MAGSVDYSRLREQTMGSGLDEEAVTVNTRALIDKVLARYSGEWTTLRELIQNAADASAKKVVIKFETVPSSTVPVPSDSSPSERLKHVLRHHTLARLLVSNNGEPFKESDWDRLKRIAEGNPDETKIGAFGVGFYSVFADCESPFVKSGDQTMAFYWKTNSLFTKRARLPDHHATGDTCFVLDYRNNTSPVPDLLSICQFLATSLTFVGLEQIELQLDEWSLITLTKKMAPSADVNIPSDINPKTKGGIMKIVGVEYQNAQIDATWMNVVGWTRTSETQIASQQATDAPAPTQSLRSFFSRLTGSATVEKKRTAAAKQEEDVQRAISEDLAGFSKASVFLRISTVNVQTYCSSTLVKELERATKKPPPKHTRIAILTSSYDETAQTTVSGSGSAKANAIFSSVLPSKNGRIFIGFPTAQTTGLLAHISAPSVIPTVERESIDLNARYVRDWNLEMLRVAGIACRVAYNGEMLQLKDGLARQMTISGNKKVSKDDLAAVIPAAAHAFKQYTYHESTPSSQVGTIIEEAFWTCSKNYAISVLSTRGVLPSSDVRLASEDLSFVDGIPVIPDAIIDKNSEFLNKLQEFGLLTEITTQDIKKELEARALDESQLTELLKWAAQKISKNQLDASAISTLFDGTVATIDEKLAGSYPGPVLMLGSIETFPNVTKIPAELPMPPTTIPFRFIKSIPKTQLEAFGWSELQIVPWLRYLLETDGGKGAVDRSLTRSPAFPSQVLPVLSKGWESLSQSSKTTVADLLSTRTVIPTKLGMRKPTEAYFSSVKLFDDLPTVQGLQGVKEKFLGAIGVRKTVELSVVFDRLMAKSTDEKGTTESKWSHVDLIKYLVSVRDDIPNEDINKLRKTPICPMEKPGDIGKADGGRLYKINELYEPTQSMRELQLPLLHWPEPFRKASPEAKFLVFLGLKTYPEVSDIVAILAKAATNEDTKMYDLTMKYFISNHFTNGYRRFPMETITTPFLLVQGQPLNKLALPLECFANERASILGFNILRRDLKEHAALFGVEQDPPMASCADRLIRNPPKTRSDAKDVFGYFAGRLNEIGPSGNLAERLGESLIVPVVKPGAGNEKTENLRYAAPRSCFLGDSQSYGEIFDFVDFGSEANTFLLKIGSKHEPSASELAGMLVREPNRLLTTLGHEKYLSLLRRISDNTTLLKMDKKLWKDLQRSSCLLSIKEVQAPSKGKAPVEDDYDEYDDDAAITEYHLMPADRIVLIDDYTSFRVFKDKLTYAPQEETLEKFYASLGSPGLSQIVEDDQRGGQPLNDQSAAKNLKKLIVERCRLFLHDQQAQNVRRDAKWLEKTLEVKVVDWITLTKTLKGYSARYSEKKTAALERSSTKDARLLITRHPDLYEVSRAIMPLMLRRPKQQDYLALEMIMESELRRLKVKGYNVDRILRQKAAESRIAQDEQNKRAEEEAKKLAEQDRSVQNQIAQASRQPLDMPTSPERSPRMPGAFDNSPEPLPPSKNKGGLFSQITQGLGFNSVSDAKKQIKQMQKEANDYHKAMEQFNQDNKRAIEAAGGLPPPYAAPPYADQGPGNQDLVKRPPYPTSSGQQPEQVTPVEHLQQNLNNAIQASRAHDSSHLYSQPTTQEIKETPTYCDTTTAEDLVFAKNTDPGIKLFLENGMTHTQITSLISTHEIAINNFAYLLLDVGSIFNLRPQSLHIFYNTSGSTIAFNKSGALFCNLRYFLQLHWDRFNAGAQAQGRVDALCYWFVCLCHEIAHNLEQSHNSQHGYYTESLFHEYYRPLMFKTLQYIHEAGDGAGAGAGPLLTL